MRIINSQDIEKSFFEVRSFNSDVQGIVADVIANVKTNGDIALHEYCEKFDHVNPASFELSEADIKACEKKLHDTNKELYDALCYSRDLALAFAKKQRECFTDFETELSEGLITGQKTIAVQRAGLYVPAGRFPLLSTVIMCASPAIAAGCDDIVLCTAPRKHPQDETKPWADENIIATASLCGIKKIFAVGGAQAIAAMASGTETIPRCDVIVGPGNKFVAEAKKQVYGTVGIDMLAGPTEVLVIADNSAHPEWVAADLLAQAEHDVDAQAILVTDSPELAEKVSAEVKNQLEKLPTKEIAAKSIDNNGIIIVAKSLEEACDIANKKAPEHLELAIADENIQKRLEKLVRNYGSLFIGHNAAEVLGDYSAGLNHTLPTSTSARFTGGLSVRHFLKTVTTLRTIGKNGMVASGTKKSLKAAELLGKAEGLYGHANASIIRQ